MEKTRKINTVLALRAKYGDKKPQSGLYRMVMPESVEELDKMSGGSSIIKKHIEDVVDNKAQVFFVCPNNEEDNTVLATALCKMGEEATFSYILKHGPEKSASLQEFEKKCVEHSVKSMMSVNRVHKASLSSGLAAYNTLGIGAIEA